MVSRLLKQPLAAIDELLGSSPETIPDHFRTQLVAHHDQIPLLNCTSPDLIAPNTLVRFRCMVQNTFDPELFLGSMEAVHNASGRRIKKYGQYRDSFNMDDIEATSSGMSATPAAAGAGEPSTTASPDAMTDVTETAGTPSSAATSTTIPYESRDMMSRVPLFCVPIPGESQWLSDQYECAHRASVQPAAPAAQSSNRRPITPKRKAPDTEDDDDGATDAASVAQELETKMDLNADEDADTSSSNKRARGTSALTEAAGSAAGEMPRVAAGQEHLGQKACIVKIYEQDNPFRVCDLVEFVGVLTKDPELADDGHDDSAEQPTTGEAGQPPSAQATADAFSPELINGQDPLASVVPRLHCVYYSKLSAEKCVLSDADAEKIKYEERLQELRANVAEIRDSLVRFIARHIGGDQNAAQYILANLISKAERRDALVIGKFALNLTNCPDAKGVDTAMGGTEASGGDSDNEPCTKPIGEILQEVYSHLLPYSSMIPLSRSSLNSQSFVPVKDYSLNTLKSGALQVPKGSALVLDETVMNQGKVNEVGVKNIRALKNLIENQEVRYDFQFYELPFPSDAPVLTVSRGKSMLGSDVQIALQPVHDIPEDLGMPAADNSQASPSTQPSPELSRAWREYLQYARNLTVGISEDVGKLAQADFLGARATTGGGANQVSADWLHTRLTFARLLAASFLETEVSAEKDRKSVV